MSNDPTERPEPTPPAPDAQGEPNPAEVQGPAASSESTPEADPSAEKPRRRVLIGSQRNPDAYRPKPKRDWEPVAKPPNGPAEPQGEPTGAVEATAPPPEVEPPPVDPPAEAPPKTPSEETTCEAPPVEAAPQAPAAAGAPPIETPPAGAEAPSPLEMTLDLPDQLTTDLEEAGRLVDQLGPVPVDGQKFPPPNIRGELSPDLEDEFQQALAGAELDDLMAQDDQVTSQAPLDTESKQTGKVVAIGREDVFVELGGREQGIIPLKQFEEPPEVESAVEVRIVRFNREEGLYELALPSAAATVGDWDDLEEGMLVEARVTGHNTGGLECEVNHIRGFIPVSQIALYHVDDLEQFADEKLTCLVTEANPRRRNLVLSRRAVLEREREEA